MTERTRSETESHASTAVAALARVAVTMELTFGVDELIRANPFEGSEPAPKLLLKIAERAGLRGQLQHIKRGDTGELAQSVPAILLMSDGRAVLLEQVHQRDGANLALLDDPASSRLMSTRR